MNVCYENDESSIDVPPFAAAAVIARRRGELPAAAFSGA